MACMVIPSYFHILCALLLTESQGWRKGGEAEGATVALSGKLSPPFGEKLTILRGVNCL